MTEMKMSTETIEYIKENKSHLVSVASGREPADIVLKNASYVNVFTNEICHCDIAVAGGRIAGIGDYNGKEEFDVTGQIVLPGLIDAHIHLESSMIAPYEFAKAVLPHGTTTVVTDPHEIANVMGSDGIEYMLQATEEIGIDVNFMLSSCVPATPVDESGASLEWEDIDCFYSHPRVRGLAEVMNSYGVVNDDPQLMYKISAAEARHKNIDGHAPDLPDYNLNAYIAAGIRSDHECYRLEDALNKLKLGQYIMIRECTAAHNLDALFPLLTPEYADRCMFCCDDRHPDDLVKNGHIDMIVKKAIGKGADPILAIKAGCYNSARYFGLTDRGAIAPGYRADMVIINNLDDFEIQKVFQNGVLRFDGGSLNMPNFQFADRRLIERAHRTFNLDMLSPAAFENCESKGVIGLVEDELITKNCGLADHVDVEHDILKIAVIERHNNTGHIGIGYLNGYGLKEGAVATSISHDSHNLIVVGTNDSDMAKAANHIIETSGGIAVVNEGQVIAGVTLEIAGLMTDDTLETVYETVEKAKNCAFSLGVHQNINPFMPLSFISLSVIPELRLTTRGIIEVCS